MCHRESAYTQLLIKKNLWPVDPRIEQDWSGRGQHAEFLPEESKALEELLVVEDTLGRTNTATVESVRCRRILLARKTILCPRPLSRKQAIDEVAHLTRLEHAHIVRVIGTYTLKRNLAILLYQVTDYNLETFLGAFRHDSDNTNRVAAMAASGLNFFSCLSSAIAYTHSKLTKHMDIKPQNILVKETYNEAWAFKVYLADFGISRSYQSEDSVETDSPTSFTRKYASPEVTRQQTRGLPADIFSLGCVFLEMFAVFHKEQAETVDAGQKAYWKSRDVDNCYRRRATVLGTLRHRLGVQLQQKPPTDRSYQANLESIGQELQRFASTHDLGNARVLTHENLAIIQRMLYEDPGVRPKAEQLRDHFRQQACCTAGLDQLELISKPTHEASEAFYERLRLRLSTEQQSRNHHQNIQELFLQPNNSDLPQTSKYSSHPSYEAKSAEEQVILSAVDDINTHTFMDRPRPPPPDQRSSTERTTGSKAKYHSIT